MDARNELRPKWNNLFRFEHASRGSQLENNVTKSLLKVLQDAEPRVSQSVLTALFKDWRQQHFEFTSFETQVGLRKLREGRLDHDFTLIGLSRFESTDAMATANDLVGRGDGGEGDGVVDAAITIEGTDGPQTIIFEVKTQSNTLDPDQLAKYQSQLAVPDERCYTLTWAQVFNAFRGELAGVDPETDPVTAYLFSEFCEFLAVEELEGVVAEKTDGATKRILVRRNHDVADNEAERYGNLEINIEWADGGRKSSTVGWITAETFEELVRDMDDELREAFRTADGSLVHSYLTHDEIDWSPSIDRLVCLAEAIPRNDSNDDAVLRLVAAAEDGRPQLRIARYVGTTYDRFTTPPYLTLGDSRDEFTLLFSDISADVRDAVFARNPDLEPLWNEYLANGELR